MFPRIASKAGEGKAARGAEEGKSSSSSAGSAAAGSASPSLGLVAKVESYFYENDDFANLFENFATEHAGMIDLQADETEFKLEYTDVYKKFTTLFETTLSAFIRRQGHEIEDFYEEVRQVCITGARVSLCVPPCLIVSECRHPFRARARTHNLTPTPTPPLPAAVL